MRSALAKGFPSSAFALALFLCLGCSGSSDPDDGAHEHVTPLDANTGSSTDTNLSHSTDLNMPTLDSGTNIPPLDSGTTTSCPEGHDGGAILHTATGNGEHIVATAYSLNKHQIWSSLVAGEIGAVLKEEHWELVGDVIAEGKNKQIQAYVARDPCEGNLVVSIRGTRPSACWEAPVLCVAQCIENIITDASVGQTSMDWATDVDVKKLQVHSGFNDDYAEIRDAIWNRLKEHPDDQIYVTGFSLGGALATLAALDIGAHGERTPILYTGGQPRVGTDNLRLAVQEHVPNAVRVVVNRDPVAMVPGPNIGFWTEPMDNELTEMFLLLVSEIGGPEIMWMNIKDYVHVGRLLQLNLQGDQMKDTDIEVGIQHGDFERHKHDGPYRSALQQHLAKCVEGAKCAETLAKAAAVERAAVGELLLSKLPWQ